MVTVAVPPTPSADRDAWLVQLREAVRRGEYRPDPHVVAEAALRDPRFRQLTL